MSTEKKWPQWNQHLLDSIECVTMFCLVARIAFTVCTRSLTACNSAINVVQRAFISMLLMERKSSVIRLWAQCAHKHAYMKQSNEKGWRWLSVQNERNKKKMKRNSTPWWSYTIFIRLQFNLFSQTFPLFLLLRTK